MYWKVNPLALWLLILMPPIPTLMQLFQLVCMMKTPDGQSFVSIDANGTLHTAAVFDWELNASFQIKFATDSTGMIEQIFTVEVKCK